MENQIITEVQKKESGERKITNEELMAKLILLEKKLEKISERLLTPLIA